MLKNGLIVTIVKPIFSVYISITGILSRKYRFYSQLVT